MKNPTRLTMGHVQCSRCGHCCQNVALNESPKKLNEYYQNWRHNKKDENGKKKNWANDIWLIYPMLMYKGFDSKVGKHRYFCKNLKKVKNKNEFFCTIYKDRPEMCADFGRDAIKTGHLMGAGNKAIYPKCTLC